VNLPEPYIIGALVLTILSGGLMSLRAPVAGVLVWAALFPVQVDTVATLGFRFAPSDVVLVGLVLGTVARARRDRLGAVRLSPVLVGSCLLFSWLVVSGGVALMRTGELSQYALVNKLVGMASLIVSFGFVMYTTRTTCISNRSVYCYCLIGSVWNAVGLIAFGTWEYVTPLRALIFAPGWEDRVRGLLVDPNAYGGYVASIAILQLCILAKSTRRDWALLIVGNSILLLTGIALANSRSAWLAFICGGVALLVHLSSAERQRLLPYGMVLTLIGSALALRAFGVGTTDYEATMRHAALDYRVQLATAALDAFRSSPVWGVGLGLFEASPGQRGYIPHSTYLWLMAETGFVGIVLLFVWVRRLYVAASNAMKSASTAHTSAIVAICALSTWLGLMIGIEAIYQRHYWFLLALCLGIATNRSPTLGSQGDVIDGDA